MTKHDMLKLLEAVGSPEYVIWNQVRIVSCIDALQSQISLPAMKTLDLGHDTYVGLLLAKAGVDLVGNIAPIEAEDGMAPAAQPSRFELPTGEVCEWALDPFDFEKRFPYEDRTFDLVTAFEVIEHVVGSPRAFVQEVKRVLRPGGYFFIGTPNVNCWPKIIRQFQHAPIYDSKPYSQNFGPRHFMCHVYEYSPWELKELLKSEGLEIMTLRTWDPYSSDPRGVRSWLLRSLVSASLVCCGYVKEALLMFKDRGHQIALLARVPE